MYLLGQPLHVSRMIIALLNSSTVTRRWHEAEMDPVWFNELVNYTLRNLVNSVPGTITHAHTLQAREYIDIN